MNTIFFLFQQTIFFHSSSELLLLAGMFSERGGIVICRKAHDYWCAYGYCLSILQETPMSGAGTFITSPPDGWFDWPGLFALLGYAA